MCICLPSLFQVHPHNEYISHVSYSTVQAMPYSFSFFFKKLFAYAFSPLMVGACVCLGWSYSVEIRQIAMISKCPSMSPKIMGLQLERGSIYKQTIHYHSLPSVKRLYSYRHRKLAASRKSKYNGDHMQATSPGKTDIGKQLEESLCCSTPPPPQEKRSMV